MFVYAAKMWAEWEQAGKNRLLRNSSNVETFTLAQTINLSGFDVSVSALICMRRALPCWSYWSRYELISPVCQYHNDTVHINDALFILKTLIINLIIAAFGVKMCSLSQRLSVLWVQDSVWFSLWYLTVSLCVALLEIVKYDS